MKNAVLVVMLFLASCAKQPALGRYTDAPAAAVSVTVTRVVLEVEFAASLRDMSDTLEFDIRKMMRKHKIGYTATPFSENGISICILDAAQRANAESAIGATIVASNRSKAGVPSYRTIPEERNCFAVEMTADFRKEFQDDVMSDEMYSAEHRIASAPQTSIKAERLTGNRFQLDIPGVLDLKQARDMFATSAEVELRLVNDNVTNDDIRNKHIPENSEILEQLPQAGDKLPPLAVYRNTVLSGTWIERATNVIAEHTEVPAVSVFLDERGTDALADFTRKNVGRRLAIVVDGKILMAPTIVSPIVNGSIKITGQFTQQEAVDIANQLNAGSVPAILRVIDVRVTDLSKP